MLTSEDITSQVEIIYQTLEGLHQAIPNHTEFVGIFQETITTLETD